MGFLATFDRAVRADSQLPPDHDFWYSETPTMSDAGVRVTTKSAMRQATFWKCVRWRASMFGMLPKKVYERTVILGRDAQLEAREHVLYPIVHTAPNPLTTSMRFFGMVEHDLCTEGNFYAFKQRDAFGQLQALWRFRPGRQWVRTEIEWLPRLPSGVRPWRLWYYFLDETGEEHRFFPDEILHLRINVGTDGITGYSPVRLQMNLLGWAGATVRYGSQFFKKASRHSGLIIFKNGVDPDKKAETIESLKASGRNAGALGLIEGDADFKQLTMNQDEAQFIETMQYQDEDICGILRVKPHKVGIMRNMTNNNVEQQNIEAVTDCLMPDCVSVEQDLDLQLLSDEDRLVYFNQNEIKALLRGDTAAQTAHIEAMIRNGVYSQNDSRDYLGLSPVEGGDRYWINRAMAPIEMMPELLRNESRPQGSPPRERQNDGGNAKAEHLRPLFRDAVGRVMNRKDRAAAVESILGAVLVSIANWTAGFVDSGFLARYLSALGQRAAEWADPDVVTAEEFDRALKAFSGAAPSESATATPAAETHTHVTVNVAQPDITNVMPTAEAPRVDVHVEPAQVTVKPPDVNVNIAAPGKRRQKVKRNQAGQITEIEEE